MCWTHAGGFGPIWVFGTASYNNHWEKLSRQLSGEDVPVSSMSGKRNEMSLAFKTESRLRELLFQHTGQQSTPLVDRTRVLKYEKLCNNCNRRGEVMKTCSGCRTAYYCGRRCQREDWKRHKPLCNPNAKLPAHVQEVGIRYLRIEQLASASSSCGRDST